MNKLKNEILYLEDGLIKIGRNEYDNFYILLKNNPAYLIEIHL